MFYLSESNTKCWLSGSPRAFANRRLSASIIEICPHITCKNLPMQNWLVFISDLRDMESIFQSQKLKTTKYGFHYVYFDGIVQPFITYIL